MRGRLTSEETAELARRAASPTGEATVHVLARTYGVTPRWVRELRSRIREGRPLPGTAPRGRPPTPVSPEERTFILRCEDEEHLNPVALEQAIERRHGIHIPHNRLWRVLREAGKVKDSPRKQRRRTWVRYERRFANSLWHSDFHELGRGGWLVTYLDDASRCLVGYAIGPRATTALALRAFEAAAARFGYPRQLLTDHGSQYTANVPGGLGEFDRHLIGLRRRGVRIQHIFSRVKHPQTNGKMERFFGTVETKEGEFPTFDAFVTWYNGRRPHMSLDFDRAETPLEAFERKLRPKERQAWRDRK
ncbi:MAG: DDE-type integrase/transposase/recombinase [Thermoplasmata archaeon]